MKQAVEALSPPERSRVELLMDEVAPRVLPPDWRLVDNFANARRWIRRDKLSAIAEVESIDGELWLHVSFARPDRTPSYTDMMLVKVLFVGRDRKAIQVLPPATEHVNIHPHCLHLFSPIDRDPLPDFRDRNSAL